MHGAHASVAVDPIAGAALLLLITAAAAYVLAAVRQRRRGRAWSGWKTASWLAGIAFASLALLPDFLPFTPEDFRQHMLQHLLLGMLAPPGLVLAAPVTLVLRSVPRRAGAMIGRLLRSTYVRIVSRPEVALVLNVGGMGLLYFTPLYEAMTGSMALHYVIHAHFLLAGCLFAWVIAGPDPAPHRPPVPYRLVVLGVAIAAHATLAQLIYAGAWVAVSAPAEQLRGGAEMMYYGGDIAELLLAFALVSTWRPRRRAAGVPATWTRRLGNA